MDPRYAQSVGYMPHSQDSYAPGGQQVQFHNVEVGDNRNKKRRGNLPKQTTDVLRAWLHDHLDHAYPSEEQKQRLIRETGLSKCPCHCWREVPHGIFRKPMLLKEIPLLTTTDDYSR